MNNPLIFLYQNVGGRRGEGGWTRDAPWKIERGYFEATYSQIKTDGTRRTAHVRVHRDEFSQRGEFSILDQLLVAITNEGRKPRWRSSDKRKRHR